MSRYADRLDAATELAEREREAALDDMRRLRAGRALNESGQCEDCGETIDPKRLAADPMVERCVSCQQDHEIRARRWR